MAAKSKPGRIPGIEKEPMQVDKEIRKVETYEYLLVEYLKEISNEMTYLVLIICSLFLFIMMDFFPVTATPDFEAVKSLFVVVILGGFFLFGASNYTKRKIEKKFEQIL